MSTRQEIIVQALRQRQAELRKNVPQPKHASSEMDATVARLRDRLLVANEDHLKKWTAPELWFANHHDSLAAIEILAAGEELEGTAGEPPEDAKFFDELQASAQIPRRRFELLTSRYLHPLNIVAPSEDKVREHLLERLMVADRSRIERDSVEQLNADDFLLRLNLVAIIASVNDDLRYLDALNYFYELLPSDWYPESQQSWLRVSFLNFYLRALLVHSARFN